LIDENNYEEYMILPKFCDITPIPLMQLLIWYNKVFTIYSSDQNSIDGFDPKGNIVKSYELDESYPDSFYVINSSQTVQTTYQLLKTTTELLTLADPDSSNLAKAQMLIKKTLSNISELQEKKIDPGTLSECEENLKKFRDKVEKKANSQTGKAILNYPVSAPNKIAESRGGLLSSDLTPNGFNTNIPKAAPNRPEARSFIPPSLTNPFQKNPVPSSNYKATEILANPKSIHQTMRQAFSQFSPVIQNDRTVSKCPGCSENLTCSLLHASCQMCDRCSFISISVFGKCMLCQSKISENDKKNVIQKLRIICNFCSRQLAATGFACFACDCLMCPACNSNSKNTKKCPRH